MSAVIRQVGLREAAASRFVLLLLVIIAGGIGWKQARFRPSVIEALGAAGVAAGSVASGGAALAAKWPEGLEPMSAPEAFTAATLSDKINGRAELYLSAGFAGLRAQRVRVAADRETWYEIYVYDMKNSRNAFAVFSNQRREGAAALDFVTHGYRTGNSLCFVNGAQYVEIVASRPGARVMAGAESLGRMLAASAAGGDGDLGESGMFPKEGLVAGSIQLIATNAFGFGRLTNIFTARYREGGETVTLFVSRRASNREAADLSMAYREFLVELDGTEADAPAGCWLVGMDGSFEGGFVSGRVFGGVHQAGSAGVAGRLLARLQAAVSSGKVP